MGQRLVELSAFERIEVCVPYDARPTGRLQYLLIEDDSVEQAGILRNDVAIIDLAREPCQGRVVAVETLQDLLLGYYFKLGNGDVRIESICECSECLPLIIPPQAIVSLGPVAWLCRRQGNAYISFAYRKIKAE